MPKVAWKNKEQEAAEWRVVKRYLGEYAGTQLGSNHNDKTTFIDPLTKKQVYRCEPRSARHGVSRPR
ncbi:hypothetical protein PsalN5692_00888 [Piscirickettsia salmonis]|uniref:hypothetical protein n=1 Tax=Piscirickettsia salmonis TaxID=1238 RepID=UPI0012B87C21|nr:hypothetical protein [Piscirickettsia salmonis]QGP49449.1 hypothetical protein PsalN5692_00888 [Piscirickettsia salmonis]